MPFASVTDCQLQFLDVHNFDREAGINRDKEISLDLKYYHIHWQAKVMLLLDLVTSAIA